MEAAAQVLVTGLLNGADYALAAVGLTLIFGVARVLNLAHGAFFALGAYLAYQVVRWGGDALLIVAPAAAAGLVLGALVERTLVRPMRGQSLTAAVVLLGLAIVAEEAFTLVWCSSSHSVPLRLPLLLFGRIVVGTEQLAGAAIAAVTLAALALFLRTRPGLAVRVVAADPEIASVCGINVARTRTATFGAACAMTAAAGACLSPLSVVSPTMERVPLILSLAMILTGGPGRVERTLAAGLAVGVASTAAAYYLGPAWSYILGLVLVISAGTWQPWRR
jgi:branched-chain amino acid transport system permease protein